MSSKQHKRPLSAFLDQLECAKQQQLIEYYRVTHAVWSGAYYPQTVIYIQLCALTSTSVMETLCQHIEATYDATIWDREYTHKSITVGVAP